MNESVRSVLDAAPFFAGLSPAVRARLVPAAEGQPMARRQRLFHQGDPADSLFLVAEGSVRLTHAGEDGGEVVVRFCGPGEIFGGIALVEAARYPVTADVVEKGAVLTWSRQTLMEVAARYPELALATTRTISSRMQELQERFREVSTQQVDRRVARALGRLARQTGRKTESGVLVATPLSRLDLAEMTGTTLFTVSRLLSAWQRQGIVAVGRERVEILDLRRLGEIAG